MAHRTRKEKIITRIWGESEGSDLLCSVAALAIYKERLCCQGSVFKAESVEDKTWVALHYLLRRAKK